MRILLDNNILIRAAASPGGLAGALLDLVWDSHLLILSMESIQELSEVLHYENVRKLHQLNDDEIQSFVQTVMDSSLIVFLEENAIPKIVPHDADDDVIVATAVAGNAEILCTLDKHLHHKDVIEYCTNHNIRVLKDIDLLNELRERKNETAE